MTTRYLAQSDAAQLPLPDAVVHCVVTSPPYYSLRKYSGEQERDWPEVTFKPDPLYDFTVTVPPMRAALGLESSVSAYLAHMILIMRDVWRVLRDDGCCWLVIGDSFAEAGQLLLVPHRLALALQGDGWTIRNDCVWSKNNAMPESVAGSRFERHRVKVAPRPTGNTKAVQTGILPNRNTVGSMHKATGRLDDPAGLAEYRDCPGCAACASNGGYVLRRGSWRHTRSQEYVLMAMKGMGYWANGEAVREALSCPDAADGTRTFGGNSKHGANLQHGERTTGRIYDSAPSGRNPRSVLVTSSEPFSGAHYAVMPTKLIAPLIRATCPSRCCPVCSAPWSPVVERESAPTEVMAKRSAPTDGKIHSGTRTGGVMYGMGAQLQKWREEHPSRIHGYRPTCDCVEYDTDTYGGPNDVGEIPQPSHPYPPVPGIVLDPFLGSGTTLAVARDLGLRGIGLDLSHEYLDQQAKVRAKVSAPSNALDELPLFKELTK